MSEEKLKQIVYRSLAIGLVNDRMLLEIQASANRFNETCGISGLLYYHSGVFLQLLEGSAGCIERVMERIAADQRHYDIRQIHEQENTHRLVATWRMGVMNLDQPEAVNDHHDVSIVPLLDALLRHRSMERADQADLQKAIWNIRTQAALKSSPGGGASRRAG